MHKRIYRNPVLLFLLVSCIFSIHTKAQQVLNLDFEQLSIEGMTRPWGWDFMGYSETKAVLDSLVKYHGKYSLGMEASSISQEQVLTFGLEPYALQNKTVVIDGWIKTKELQGEAGFFLSYISDNDTIVTEIKSRVVSNSMEWARQSVTVRFPGKVSLISLGVCHKGIGAAWFDNFSLTVNGKMKQQLEIAPAFTKEQIAWLNSNSYPIKTVDALQVDPSSEDDDLAMFRSMTGDARIIALGEATHGTSEFFRLKHRILEYSVKNMGVRVFAIEDHQLVVTRVNNYVLGGKGTARSSMYGMLGVWQTKEVHDLIEWIRTYNDDHPEDKVEFVGFDIQNHSPQIDSLYSFIAKQSPALSQPVKALLNDLMENGKNSFMVSDSIKLSWFEHSKKDLEMISEHSGSWLLNAKNRQDSLFIYWGIQYATLVKQFAENVYKGHSSLYRDIAMAENVSWILNVYKPGSKILIWAHDVHISRGDHPDSKSNIYYGKSMGAHLSKKYKNDYRSFGLFTYQGEYSCYVSYTNFKVTDCTLYNAPGGSLDEALHRAVLYKKSPALLLDLGKARSLDWLIRPIPVRFANHVNIEYGYWTKYSIPYQFDGILFIDKTTSAKSYARIN